MKRNVVTRWLLVTWFHGGKHAVYFGEIGIFDTCEKWIVFINHNGLCTTMQPNKYSFITCETFHILKFCFISVAMLCLFLRFNYFSHKKSLGQSQKKTQNKLHPISRDTVHNIQHSATRHTGRCIGALSLVQHIYNIHIVRRNEACNCIVRYRMLYLS